MENAFFLITGTSRGIGEALAEKILEKGNTVLGVSRNRSSVLKSPNYYHLSFDLTDTSRISQIMEKVHEIVDRQSFELVCLVNNASAIEPLKSIEKCSAAEIESHVAPMILTSMFISKFSSDKIRKKVAFISSASAFNPTRDASLYCSSKAGINMFTKCVGLEQKNRVDGFEVISIDPGMVDTSMQALTRSKTRDEFSAVGFFKQAFDEGKLQEPSQIAEKIYAILENTYEQGKHISVHEA